MNAERRLALGGLVFVALIVLAVLTSPNLSTHATAARTVAFYRSKTGPLRVSAIATTVAIFEGLLFFWFLRGRLSRSHSTWGLETVAFAGSIVFAVSGAVDAGVKLALADAAGHVDASAVQTLNVLYGNVTFVLAAAGVALFLVANGIAIVRSDVLPPWLGWAGIVLGVIAFLGIGAPLVGVWILAASVTLLVRAGRRLTPEPV